MKKGFTLLELLVASLLLGMLLTILTQLFTQSSIAWRTGESGVSNLDQMRADISAIQRAADNAILVKGDTTYPLCSVWKGRGILSDRGFSKDWQCEKFTAKINQPSSWSKLKVESEKKESTNIKNYLVGVTSAGPDGKFDTWDDITSWPNDSDE